MDLENAYQLTTPDGEVKRITKDSTVLWTRAVNTEIAMGETFVPSRSLDSLGMTISGNSTQDGTPTPDNPIEILSCGDKTKNLCSSSVESYSGKGITAVRNDDGSYTINGTATSNCYITLGEYSPKVGTVYKMFGGYASAQLYIFYPTSVASANFDNGSGATWTENHTDTVARITVLVKSGDTLENVILQPMLTTDISATAYEPYGKYKIPVKIGEKEYHCFLSEPLYKCHEGYEDILTMTQVERHSKRYDAVSADAWNFESRYPRANLSLADGKTGSRARLQIPFSQFTFESSGGTAGQTGFYFLSTVGLIYIYPPATVTDLETFQAWLDEHPFYCIYPLATPTTETVTWYDEDENVVTAFPLTKNQSTQFVIDTTTSPSSATLVAKTEN